MVDKLYEAKEVLTLLTVWRHTPEAFSALEGKPAVVEEAVARGFDVPCSMLYVDEEERTLVVGLVPEAAADGPRHEADLREILGEEIPFRLDYARVVRDAAPSKKQDCRPLWGGVRMNGDATLGVVYDLGQGELATILSSHAVGANGKTGQTVGQAAHTSPYGVVTVNPSLSYRASDSALARITNSRISGEPNRIWRSTDRAYAVVDYAISQNTPVRTVLYMQGAQSDDLRRGVLLEKRVTVADKRGTLTDQIVADYEAQGGDSGAPIFYMAGEEDYVVFVGVHAGRVETDDGTVRPYYSPWESIREELNLPQYRVSE